MFFSPSAGGEKWGPIYWHPHARPVVDFYRTPEWRAIRNAEIASNRRWYGRGTPTCERCGAWRPWRIGFRKVWLVPFKLPFFVERKWEGDHIFPRSLFPERELDPNNVQALCEACNRAKGNRATINWKAYRRWPLCIGYPVVWARVWHQRAYLGWSA